MYGPARRRCGECPHGGGEGRQPSGAGDPDRLAEPLTALKARDLNTTARQHLDVDALLRADGQGDDQAR